MSKPIKVAQILGKMNNGGIEAVVMNYYRHIDKSMVQFDFFIEENSTFPQREELEKAGAKIYKIPAYTKVIAYNNTLKKIFAENNYTIVHAHLSTMSLFPLLAAWRAKVPVRICHNHSMAHMKEGVKTILKYILRPCCKLFATHYFSCGEEAAKWMYGKKLCQSGKVHIMRNAIETERFQYDAICAAAMKKELKIENSAFVVGHIGRLCKQKNQAFLLDVFRVVASENENAVLLIVGEGELQEALVQQAKQYGLNDKVVFAGVRQDVDKIYSAMDVLCLPSLYEGFPVVAVEGLANHLPEVCSNRITKEIAKFPNVIMLGLDDAPGEWARLILKAKRNNVFCAQAQIDEFDIKKCAQNLENIYSAMYSCIVRNNK